MSKTPTPVNNRSAVTGQFVTPSYAKTHKSTTVTERRTPPAPTPKKGR